jgi:hypothetical protein
MTNTCPVCNPYNRMSTIGTMFDTIGIPMLALTPPLKKREFFERGYKYNHVCPTCGFETPWYDSRHRKTTPHVSWLILKERERRVLR